MDIKDVLTKRFTKAIKNALPRNTPLIGPKWFNLHPSGTPADFQFTGCAKLAKATAMRPDKILDRILAKLSVDDIASAVERTADHKINVTLLGKGDKGDMPADGDEPDKGDKPEGPGQ